MTTHRTPRLRHAVRALVGIIAGVSLLAGTASTASAATTTTAYVTVTIKAVDGQLTTAQNIVLYLGGTITKHAELPGVFEARIPVQVDPLYVNMAQVSPQGANMLGLLNSFPQYNECARWPTDYSLATAGTAYNPASELYSLESTVKVMGADKFHTNGFRGQGIDVALLDTGVSAPAGPLAAKVIDGPDFSFDSPRANMRSRDAYGHGTHMAAIINAVAPDARILNLKVGDANGAQDVTQLIAAIDWVREHRKSYGLNVRVISISYGAVSKANWTNDELSLAVQMAWDAGMVVVASGGNDGRANSKYDPGINAPAFNKDIIAVGGYDPGTLLDPKDDKVTDFNSGASSSNKRDPDFVTPGKSIASVRVPFGAADEQILADVCEPTAHRWPLLDNGRFVRGSGSSQSAAAAAGAVALALSKDVATGKNWFTSDTSVGPDFLKTMLKKSTNPVPYGTAGQVGDGSLSLTKLYGASLPRSPGNTHDPVTLLNNIDDTRNLTVDPATGQPVGAVVSPFSGQPVVGRFDVLGNPYEGYFFNGYLGPQRWFSLGGCKVWAAYYWHNYSANKPTTADCWIADPGPALVLSPTNPYPAYVLPLAPGFADNPADDGWDAVRWRAGTWDGLRWRDAGWEGVRWRDNGWDGLRWRDNGWDGLRWRQFGWDSLRWRAGEWDSLRWRDSAWADHHWR